MFNNMKIGMRLGLGFALVVAMLVTTLAVSVYRLSELNGSLQSVVNDRFPKTVWANDIIDALNMAARSTRNMLLDDDPAKTKEELDRITAARGVISDRIAKLEEKVNTDEGRRILRDMKEKRVRYVANLDQLLKLIAEHRQAEARALLLADMRVSQAAYLEDVSKMIVFQSEMVDKAGKDAAELYAAGRNLVLALSAAAILLAIAIGVWVTRSVTGPIGQAVDVANRLAAGDLTMDIQVTRKDETGRLLASMREMVEKLSRIIGEVRAASDNLSSASEQVSATAQSLSQGAAEQAASVEETTSTIEQARSSIAQNTENAKVTDSMASKAATEAAEGGDAVRQTVAAMKSIAGKIGIIDDIAYQTNLLALNAAIEAARAGDHGKGFAVVAAEVRKLAERSQVAAQEIGELAGSSVNLAERAGKLLDEMVPTIRKTSDLVQEIASASEEQSGGVAQITIAMGQLNQATQQSASASEELAATSEEMSSQAEQLQGVMGFFKVAGMTSTRPVRKQGAQARRKPVDKFASDEQSGDFEFVRF